MWCAQTMANRKRRNNDVAYEITNAIHRMVDAMQPDGSTTSSHDPTYSASDNGGFHGALASQIL